MVTNLLAWFKDLVDQAVKEREVRPPYDKATIEKHIYKQSTVNGVAHGTCAGLEGLKEALVSKGKVGSKELNQIIRELVFDYFLNDVPHAPYFKVAQAIFDNTGQESGTLADLENTDAWKSAISSTLDYLEFNQKLRTDTEEQIRRTYLRLYSVSKQARFLKSKGVQVNIENGRLGLDGQEYKSICKQIDDLVKEIGGFVVFKPLMHEAKKNWGEKFFRFHFVRRTSTTNEPKEASIPWGYLINLCAKYPYRNVPDNQAKDKLIEVFRMATAISALFDVEPYSTFDGMFNNGDSILYYLRDIVIYDTIFAIPQVRPKDSLELCKGLFSWADSDAFAKKMGWTIKEALEIFTELSKRARPFDYLIFGSLDLKKALSGIPKDRLKVVLDVFSHEKSANKNYLDPNEYPTINFQFKPLIKLDKDKYLLLNPPICFIGLFEAISSCIRKSDLFKEPDSRMGEAFEDFVKLVLINHSVQFHSGIYRLNGKEERECDLVIETKERIIFIELKKKSLTPKARSGDVIELLGDISSSFLDSQIQLGEHELFLREKGELELTDGERTSKIILNGREIERISIALDEYGGLQDRTVIQQILRIFAVSQFKAVDLKDQKKIDYLSEQCRIISEQLQKVKKLDEKANPERFFNCWFLSAYQFMVLMEDVKSCEDFWIELRKTRSTSFSTLDFYFEYHNMKGLKIGSS